MKYFLAIDAGGTKTDYLLADESRTLAKVRGGTIKRMRTDAESARTNLESALDELTRLSGIAMDAVERCCVGTAGDSVPLVMDWLRKEIPSRVAGELLLLGDVEIALDAAFHGGPGALVLSGTGSNLAGRTAEGVILRVGGWGPVLADQGSGHRIGVEAVRASFLAKDEGRETSLLGAIMQLWELRSMDQLIEYGNHSRGPDFSQLTPLVAEAAKQGDEVANEVLRVQGRELGYLLRLLIRRLKEKAQSDSFLPDVAFAGSVMECVTTVRDIVVADVRQEFPEVIFRSGTVDPIQGALWHARDGSRPLAACEAPAGTVDSARSPDFRKK